MINKDKMGVVGEMLPDYLVDVGNTSCKVMAVGSVDLVDLSLAAITRHLHEDFPPELRIPGKKVVLAGSNTQVLDLWCAKITGAGSTARILVRDDIPIKREMVDPTTVGVDRLLVCLGAQVENGPGPHLVVDAGTAITANFIDDLGRFRGGAIGPGMGVMNQSLARKASSLFEVEWNKVPAAFPASTTREAISLGIHMAATGFTREAWSRAQAEFPKCRLHLTGRDSTLIFPSVPEANLDPVMFFRGMLAAIGFFECKKNEITAKKGPG